MKQEKKPFSFYALYHFGFELLSGFILSFYGVWAIGEALTFSRSVTIILGFIVGFMTHSYQLYRMTKK